MDIGLIMNIAFFAIIGFGIIGALVGIWKGIWKMSFKLIFTSVLVILFIFLTPTITKAVCSIDLTQFFHYSVNFNGKKIAVSTVDETVVNFLIASGYVSPTASASIYTSVLALSHSIISYVVFFVLMILTFILGPLFSALFYHCLFKFFIPRKVRRRHKVRWLSGIVGFTTYVAIFVMLLSPLTALANTLAKEKQAVENLNTRQVLNNTQYEKIVDALDAYNNSLLFKTLTLNGNATGIDYEIINKATTSVVEGTSISFFEELSNILTIAGPVSETIEVVTTETGSITIELSSLYAKSVVNAGFALLQNSALIMGLVPALVDIGIGIAKESITQVDLSKIDLSDVDWSSQFSALNDCYGKLYDAGLIEYLTIKGTDKTLITDENISLYREALKTVGNTDLVKSLMPLALNMANSAMKEQGFDVFITENLDDIAWGEELADAFIIVSDLLDTLEIDINKLIDPIEGESYDFAKIFQSALADETKLGQIKKSIVGEKASATEEAAKGLLDLQLFTTGLVDITKLFETSLTSFEEIQDFVNPNLIINAISNMSINEWKTELDNLLDIVPLVYENKNLNFSEPNGIDFKNEATIADLREVVKIASDSSFLMNVLPEIAENALANSELNGQDLMGLTISDFNFRTENLPEELNNLFDIVPTLLSLMEVLEKDYDNAVDMLNALEIDDLETILVAVVSSDLLNPSRDIDGTGVLTANINIEKIIRSFLGDPSMQEVGIVLPDDLSSIQWLDKNGVSGEISNLLDAVEYIRDDVAFLLSGEEVDIQSLSGNIISTMLDYIGNSQLLKPSIVPLMNKNVSPLLEQLGVVIDFNIVDDWSLEGERLGTLVDSLKDVISADIKIENIDWLNLDPNKLNSILTAYYSTSLAKCAKNNQGYYIDNFANLIYTIINDANLSDVIGEVNYYQFAAYDYQTGASIGWNWVKETGTVEIDVGTAEKPATVTRTITTNGEIKNLVDVMNTVTAVGVDNITSGDFDPDSLSDLLNAVNDSNILSPLLVKIVEMAVSNIDPFVIGSSTISLSDMNIDSFTANDIDSLVAVYKNTVPQTITNPDGSITQGPSLIESLTDINSLDVDAIDDLNTLLDDLYKVGMISTPKTGVRYSLYEQIIGAILNLAQIDTIITGINDSAKAQEAMTSIIHSVYGSEFNTATNFEDNPAAIENQKLTDTMKLLVDSEGGLDTDIISTDPTKIEPALLSDLLTSLNHSKLLHAAIPNLFDKIMTQFNIDSLIGVPSSDGNASIIYHPIDTLVHLTSSEEDMLWWDSNIAQIVQLFENIRDDSGSIIDLANLTISSDPDSFQIIDVLNPIDQMPLFEHCKEYIVYNLFKQTSSGEFQLLDYIRDLSVHGEDPKAARIKTLLFWDGHTEADLDRQCTILQGFMSVVKELTNGNSLGIKDGNVDNELPINLIMGTMKYFAADSSNPRALFVRSGLLSEIMSKVLLDTIITEFDLNNLDSPDYNENQVLISNLDSMFYPGGNDYGILNLVEARGIQGLMKLLALTDWRLSATETVEISDILPLLVTNRDEFINQVTTRAVAAAAANESVKAFEAIITPSMYQLGPISVPTNASHNGYTPYDETLEDGKYLGYNALLYKTYQTDYTTNNEGTDTLSAHNTKLGLILFNMYAEDIVLNGVTNSQSQKDYTLAEIATIAGIDSTSDAFTFEALSNEIVSTLKNIVTGIIVTNTLSSVTI